MKTILKLTILFMIVLPTVCEASSIFPGFSLLYENIEKYYPETDNLKRKETRVYNNYRLRRVSGDYYFLNDNPTSFPYLYYLDNILSDRYLRNCSDGCSSTFLIRNDMHGRYVSIRDFNRYNLKIDSIRFYDNGNLINHTLFSSNYSYGNDLTPSTLIVFDLRAQYYLRDLQVEVNFTSADAQEISFDLYFYEHFIMGDPWYPEMYYQFSLNPAREKEQALINFASESRFYEIGRALRYHDDQIKEMKSLRYTVSKELMFRYYALERVNTGIYTEIPLDDHEHDLNDMKIFFSYYARDNVNQSSSNRNLLSRAIDPESVKHEDEDMPENSDHLDFLMQANLTSENDNYAFKNGDKDSDEASCPFFCYLCLACLIIMIILMSIIIKKKN